MQEDFDGFPGRPDRTPAYARFEGWWKQSTAFLSALRSIQDEKKAYWVACDHVRVALFGGAWTIYQKKEITRDRHRMYRLIKILEKNGSIKTERQWKTTPGAIGKQRIIYLHTDWMPSKKTSFWQALFGGETNE